MASKKSSRQEIIIGTFVLIGFILLIIITVSLGTFSIGEKTYTITARFRYVSGLEIGAPVKVYGTSAGQVTDIRIIPGDRPVEVSLRLSEKYKVRKNARIKVTQFGIMGEKVIDIDLGSTNEIELGNGAVLNGIDPFDPAEVFEDAPAITSNLTNIIRNLNEVLGTEETKVSIRNIVTKVEELTAKVDNILGTSGEDVGDAISNIREASKKLDKILTDFGKIIEEGQDDYIAAGKNFNSTLDTIRDESKTIVTKMDKLLEKLDSLTTDVDLLVEENREEVKDSIKSIRQIAEKIDNLLAKVEQGEGTISMLINDPKLYEELVNSVREIRKWVDIRSTTEFPDRIKYENKGKEQN